MTYAENGARVQEVTPGSAAEDVGIRAGDIIVKLDDRTIDDPTELVVSVRDYAPGDTVEVGYERDGKGRTATLTLGDDAASG